MHDPWTDRLSAYMDGGLDAAEARSLEEHLESCDACADTLAGLRNVVATARALQDREPAQDLWAGIAAGISATGSTDTTAPAPVPHGPVTSDGRLLTHRRWSRALTVTMPQLAAAAVLLVSLSAGAVWMLAGAGRDGGAGRMAEGTIFQSTMAPSPSARFVEHSISSPEAQSLQALLDDARDTLDPATVEVLERSIESIEEAIAMAQAALSVDPGNERLQRQLDSTLQRRQDLAARVTRVQRGGA
jgi:hypothetical protein